MPGFYYWPDYPESHRLARVKQLPREERRRCKHRWEHQARDDHYGLPEVCGLCGALEGME